MGFWLIVFTFCFATAALGMFFDYRKQQLSMMSKLNEMDENAMQKELAGIKQRLAVLEKIITDKRYDLEEELSRLHPHS